MDKENIGYRPNENLSLARRPNKPDVLSRKVVQVNGLRHFKEVGFQTVETIPTKKASWDIMERFAYRMPVFPTGETLLYSAAGLYQVPVTLGEGEFTRQIVLRTSLEPFKLDEFVDSVKSVGKYYVERPRILGLPSWVFSTENSTALGLFSGVSAVALAGWLAGEGPTQVSIASLLGGVVNSQLFKFLGYLGEKHAIGKIKPQDQYVVGNEALTEIRQEQNYKLDVAIQREVYEALGGRGAYPNPNEFTYKVYRQIPHPFLEQRKTEISDELPAKSLPALLSVAADLQSI